jgi:hypothetical protein
MFADGRVFVSVAHVDDPPRSHGGTEVVDVDDPAQPRVVGRIATLSGRLAVGSSGVYFSTGGTWGTSGSTSDGGLHVASLDPQCSLAALRTEHVVLDVVVDPSDGTRCGSGGSVVFSVCRAANVTLKVDGVPASLMLRNVSATPEQAPQPASPIDGRPLEPGLYVASVPPGYLGTGIDTQKKLTLEAVSQADATDRVGPFEGRIENQQSNRSVLPVGHTLSKGVDLMDGHVVRQSSDIKLQGRHVGLEVVRTYSSSAESSDDVMGAGWSWNYAAAVRPTGCGVAVSTADGSSHVPAG